MIPGGNNITFEVTDTDMQKNKLRVFVMDEGNPVKPEEIAPGISHVDACQSSEDGSLLTKVEFLD